MAKTTKKLCIEPQDRPCGQKFEWIVIVKYDDCCLLIDVKIHFYNFFIAGHGRPKISTSFAKFQQMDNSSQSQLSPEPRYMHQKYDYPVKGTAQKIWYELLKFR